MRTLYITIVILFFAVFVSAQTKPISKEDYARAFEYALSETNSRFPFRSTFTSEIFDNGSLVSKSIHVSERQDSSIERKTFTDVVKGKTTKSFQLRTAAGDNVYCSTDGKRWTGPQKYECPRTIRLFRPRTPKSVEYTVEEKTVSGKKVLEYRKFEIYETDGKTPEFDENIALIGANGLFVSTKQTMGDLQTKSIHTRLTNTWALNAKFRPITVPKNLAPASKTVKNTNTITLIRN